MIVGIVVVGTLVGDAISFKSRVATAIDVRDWGSSIYETDKSNFKVVVMRGVVLGFDNEKETIGESEFVGGVNFLGIDRTNKFFRFRVPMVVKTKEEYSRAVQFSKNSYSGKEGLNNIYFQWEKVLPGSVFVFLISPDPYRYFLYQDGGDQKIFENKYWELTAKANMIYFDKYGDDFKEIFSGNTNPKKMYHLIEMSVGEVEPQSALKIPILFQNKFIGKIPYE